MIDLKNILKECPNCLSSRASFKAILMDKYPNEKRTVNILTIMFECGIVQKIKCKQILEENDFQSLLLQLEADYGIDSQYSNESIRIWANAFDTEIRAAEILEQVSSPQAPIRYETIVHAPIVEKVVVEGAKSDYETMLDNGTMIITKFIGFDEKVITVPNIIDGVEIKIIGENAFAKCTGIEKVIISEGITEIHNGAFSGCTSLKEVILPTSLLKLGSFPPKPMGPYVMQPAYYKGVFENCAIAEIQFPADLIYIGPHTFQQCKNLRKINLPNKIQDIQESCFSGCSALAEVFLPDDLKSICCRAFYNCGITKIDIPVTVTKIEHFAFKGCEHLTSVLLHEGISIIEDHAFENNYSLFEITIPKSVSSIGKAVFDVDILPLLCRRDEDFSARRQREDLVIACYAGSYGLEYARKGGYKIRNAAK